MSGHSKWAQIKRKKGVTDARRGNLFTKIAREIMVAAREGGDPEANFRLRMAIQKAREVNMPNDNIERSIKRGTGDTEGAAYEEITYEGYGPHGTAFIVETLTDSRNRTVSEVRNIFNRSGGSLGEAGCVGWLFDRMGVISVELNGKDGDELALMAIDAGADDVKVEDDVLEAYTQFADLRKVQEGLLAQGLEVASADITMIPKSTMALGEKEAIQNLKLVDKLEDLDDVQKVSTNLDVSDEVLTAYEEDGR
jgi:YebC/PmpR family DNA-binding regulatory protein